MCSWMAVAGAMHTSSEQCISYRLIGWKFCSDVCQATICRRGPLITWNQTTLGFGRFRISG